MKVILTQEKLAKALAIVGRIASPRTTLPILSNILIKAEENQLILSATNLEVAITETISAKVEKNGVITVPAKLLMEFVANLPKVNVTLTLADDKLSVVAGNYKSTINTMDAEDYPEIPDIVAKNKITIPADLFKKSVANTSLVASSDTTRPVLTGVYIYVFEGDLYFVATDGYRLAEKKVMPYSDEISMIVPAATLNDVSRILGDDTKEIEIGFSDDQISFEIDDTVITSRLVSGNFINYRQLIPTKTDVKAVLSRSEFVRVVKVSELFARESAGSIVMTADSKKSLVNVHSIVSQIGENSNEIEATVSGDGTVTLNSKFLLDCLGQIEGENIKIQFSGKLAPILIVGENDKNYKHIIMPVKS
ncbi:DNA polymerase III subunit beta [Candidatus Saccharibacteria bacterium]|nr:DNA polymerase III subunit beta [Candidatus Saccharibacteria bacterium]MCL1963355.1 DNA polymerase III subunit beta [Candidatus Saccharibacteria bacterium]